MREQKKYPIGTFKDAQESCMAALTLVARLRAAVGDPEGKLMQDELIDHCQRLLAKAQERKAVHQWLNDIGTPTREATGKPMCLLRRLAVQLGVAPHVAFGPDMKAMLIPVEDVEAVAGLLKMREGLRGISANDERMHPYQRGRASITGMRFKSE